MKKLMILAVIVVALFAKSIVAMESKSELNLTEAASGARLEEVIILLKSGVNPNGEYRTNYGFMAPLIAAAYNVGRFGDMPELEQGFIEIIKLLIQEGANVDQQDKNGWTALMSNANKFESEYSLEVTKILLDAGANPLLKNNYGKSAFELNRADNTETKALLDTALNKNSQN
jgi:hypothetical protein